MEKKEEDMLSSLLLLFKSIETIPCNSQKFFSKAIEPITNKIIHTIKQSSKGVVYPKPSLISPSFLIKARGKKRKSKRKKRRRKRKYKTGGSKKTTPKGTIEKSKGKSKKFSSKPPMRSMKKSSVQKVAEEGFTDTFSKREHKDFIKSYITHIQRSAFMIDNSLTILVGGHGCSECTKSIVKNDLIVFFSKDGYDLNVKEIKGELKLLDSLISGKKKAEEIFQHLIQFHYESEHEGKYHLYFESATKGSSYDDIQLHLFPGESDIEDHGILFGLFMIENPVYLGLKSKLEEIIQIKLKDIHNLDELQVASQKLLRYARRFDLEPSSRIYQLFSDKTVTILMELLKGTLQNPEEYDEYIFKLSEIDNFVYDMIETFKKYTGIDTLPVSILPISCRSND